MLSNLLLDAKCDMSAAMRNRSMAVWQTRVGDLRQLVARCISECPLDLFSQCCVFPHLCRVGIARIKILHV